MFLICLFFSLALPRSASSAVYYSYKDLWCVTDSKISAKAFPAKLKIFERIFRILAKKQFIISSIVCHIPNDQRRTPSGCHAIPQCKCLAQSANVRCLKWMNKGKKKKSISDCRMNKCMISQVWRACFQHVGGIRSKFSIWKRLVFAAAFRCTYTQSTKWERGAFDEEATSIRSS